MTIETVSAARFGYRCPRCSARTLRLAVVPGIEREELVCGICARELDWRLAIPRAMHGDSAARAAEAAVYGSGQAPAVQRRRMA